MTETLSALLQEGRTFPPPPEFAKQALVTDASVYDDAERDWQGFWARQALALDWHREWDTILDWELPFAQWFVGGKLNVSENCLDRHVQAGHGGQVALHWEGEPGDRRAVTYQELLDETSRVANLLRELGVAKGDRVAIYMGMVPETVAAMLACARIGAAHSVVFGGFTTKSRGSRPSARRSRWTPRICCSSSTRRARPGSPRASCTRPAVISRRSRTPTSTCSTSSPTPTSTGVP